MTEDQPRDDVEFANPVILKTAEQVERFEDLKKRVNVEMARGRVRKA